VTPLAFWFALKHRHPRLGFQASRKADCNQGPCGFSRHPL